jgi:hypothetical protein
MNMTNETVLHFPWAFFTHHSSCFFLTMEHRIPDPWLQYQTLYNAHALTSPITDIHACSPMPSSLEIVLPPSTLMIKPVLAAADCSTTRPQHPPSLRVTIKVHLSVQSELISERISGRKLEECVDVVVPVGSTVRVGLAVDTDYLPLEKESTDDDAHNARLVDYVQQITSTIIDIVSPPSHHDALSRC